MLFQVDPQSKQAQQMLPSSYASLGVMERYDLQEWILGTPEILGEPLLIISTEYDRFDKTSERLDLLAIDEAGKLVVIELKRNAAGTTADLQALRYAAYCSTLTVDDLATERSAFIQRRQGTTVPDATSRQELFTFAPDLDGNGLDSRPRIILGAEDFSPEITATVLWLRDFGIDISCVRLTPYKVGNQILLNSSVLIPLPEAEEFLIRREQKEDVAARARFKAPEQVIEGLQPQLRDYAERVRQAVLAEPGVVEQGWAGWISYRGTDRTWRTWIAAKKNGLWVALPPEAQPSPALEVRMTKYGWWDVHIQREDELNEVLTLLAKDYGVRHATLGNSRSTGGGLTPSP